MHLFFCEWHLVNRRVGGLEVLRGVLAQRAYVNRRVGGLEDALRQQQAATGVNRRVGGLEETKTTLLQGN